MVIVADFATELFDLGRTTATNPHIPLSTAKTNNNEFEKII
jgi:hypothetical protein